MTEHIHIARITTEACLPLRREILWPSLTEEECRVPQDPEATHLGAFRGETLVGCLSLCPIGPDLIQLRKFAVAAEWQGNGIGAQRLELDARSSAFGFYSKFGMSPVGPVFFKGPIEHQRMGLVL